jgi:hypothetical protein
MTEGLDPQETVSFKELLVSNMIEFQLKWENTN